MSVNVTKQDIVGLEARLERKLDKTVDDLSEIIAHFIQQVDNCFTQLEHEVTQLTKSHDRLLNTIDGFVGRIDSYEVELAALDSQCERLLA